MKAYCSATIVSVSVALAGNKLVQKLGGGGLLGKVRVLSPSIRDSVFLGSLLLVLVLLMST